MSADSMAGCGVRAVFALLFAASVALNVALLSGCETVTRFCRTGTGGEEKVAKAAKVYDATDDLKEIASKLGVETEGQGALEIASAIKTKIYVDGGAKGFPKEVFSEQQLKEATARLPENKQAVLTEYHNFIKSLEGKRFIVIQ